MDLIFSKVHKFLYTKKKHFFKIPLICKIKTLLKTNNNTNTTRYLSTIYLLATNKQNQKKKKLLIIEEKIEGYVYVGTSLWIFGFKIFCRCGTRYTFSNISFNQATNTIGKT